MASITKRVLSGSTDGFPINVSQTAFSGTLIHTGSTSTNTIDEVYVYAYSSATSVVSITVEMGGASASGIMRFDIPPLSEPFLLLPGIILQGRSATGADLRVGASTSNVVSLIGWVNRITQ